jgi:hypothetical protein
MDCYILLGGVGSGSGLVSFERLDLDPDLDQNQAGSAALGDSPFLLLFWACIPENLEVMPSFGSFLTIKPPSVTLLRSQKLWGGVDPREGAWRSADTYWH